MHRTVICAAVVVIALGTISASSRAVAFDGGPKYTIKQIMAQAHKSKLLRKVLNGEASPEQKKYLLELYKALPANTPPKGTARSWRSFTSTIVTSAHSVVEGKLGAVTQLKLAVNCAVCHKAHHVK